MAATIEQPIQAAATQSDLPTLVTSYKTSKTEPDKSRVIIKAADDLAFIRKIVSTKGLVLGVSVNRSKGSVTFFPLKGNGANHPRMDLLNSYISS